MEEMTKDFEMENNSAKEQVPTEASNHDADLGLAAGAGALGMAAILILGKKVYDKVKEMPAVQEAVVKAADRKEARKEKRDARTAAAKQKKIEKLSKKLEALL